MIVSSMTDSRWVVGAVLATTMVIAGPRPAGAQTPFPYRPRLGIPAQHLSMMRPPAPRPFQVHDLINVAVDERLLHETIARANRRKQREYEIEFEDAMVLLDGFRLRADNAIRQDRPGFEIEAENTIRNTMQNTRRDRLQVNIQAEITEIRPNGNLVIDGHKTVEVDNEVTTIKLNGIARPGDVIQDPLYQTARVSSEKIANAKLRISLAGPTRDAVKRGWLTRLIDMFGPF